MGDFLWPKLTGIKKLENGPKLNDKIKNKKLDFEPICFHIFPKPQIFCFFKPNNFQGFLSYPKMAVNNHS